jgi:Transcriptional regulator
METEPVAMRQKILDTALSLFVAHGYDGISMREIAEACGLSKAGLYYHFTDKQALFLAILDGQLSQLEDLLAKINAGGGDARTKIDAFLRVIFSQAADQSALIRLAAQDMSKVEPDLRNTFHSSYQTKFLDPLGAILQSGIESGDLKRIDTHLGVWALLGLVYPYLGRPLGQEAEKERTIAFIEQVLFDGLSAK